MPVALQDPKASDFSDDLALDHDKGNGENSDSQPYLGYRYVRQPNGKYLQVNLTFEDWVHPKVGDRRLATGDHAKTINYFCDCAERVFTARGQGSYTRDQLLMLGGLKLVPPVKDMQPDVGVFPDMPLDQIPSSAPSYKITEQTLPKLVIEVLSDETAHLDRGRKRNLYERIGVEQLVLVDVRTKIYRPRYPLVQGFVLAEQPQNNPGRGRRAQHPQRVYVEQIPDAQGRIPLLCLGLSLVVEDQIAYLYNHNGERILYSNVIAMQAEARIQQAETQAKKAKAEAKKAKAEAQKKDKALSLLQDMLSKLPSESPEIAALQNVLNQQLASIATSSETKPKRSKA